MLGLSKKQAQIFAFPESGYDALICDGAIRSGKTTMMAIAFFDDAMRRFNGQRFGVCGRTVDSAIKNIIEPFLASGIASSELMRCQVIWRRAEKVLILRRENTTNKFEIFGGKDERSYTLIQGRTLAGVLLDEVALMPESFVKQALSRCSVTGSKFWFNCNPESSMHWFKKDWIDHAQEHNALHLHFSLDDNPSLSKEIKERYRRDYTGVFYDRYILGLWVLAEGLVYQLPEAAIVDEIPTKGEYYISCDYGTLNPFSAGLWCWDGKTATRIREYYYSGRETHQNKTDEEYYAELLQLASGLDIESVIVDPSAASFIEVIKRHHDFKVRKAVNDVVPGIETTARFLQNGTVKIHRSCKDAIREFGLYRWDENCNEDRPIKENDHAMDEIRYFCQTVLRYKVRSGDRYVPFIVR